MDNGLLRQVRRVNMPDLIHYVEIETVGMTVTCRVVEDRGRFTITREMYQTNKSVHKWYDHVQMFVGLATRNYNVPIEERLSNAHKAGSA